MSGHAGAGPGRPGTGHTVHVALAGEQTAAALCLSYLLERGDTNVCVVVASTPEGESTLGPLAAEARIPLIRGELNDQAAALAAHDLDFIFAFQHRRSLEPEVRATARRDCINLHLGKLPRYAGWYPVVWALLNGEAEAGVTLHAMEGDVNTGPVFAQAAVSIASDTTARDLFNRLAARGANLFREVYPLIRSGAIRPVPQDLRERTCYGPDSLDLEQDGTIDWEAGCDALLRRVCAFSFEPYHTAQTWVRLPDGRKQRVSIAEVVPSSLPSQPASPGAGRVREILEDGALLVETRDGKGLRVGMLAGRNPRAYLQELGVGVHDLRFISPRAGTAESPAADLTAKNARVGPYCTISQDSSLAVDVVIQGYSVLGGCQVGVGTRIGNFVEIQRGAILGCNVRVQSHTFICDGVTLEDDVFVGHHVTFINERYPTVARLDAPVEGVVAPTRVGRGASIGSGAVISSGITIGEGAVVGAGSVVTADVAPHTVVAGVPARLLRVIAPEDQHQGGARLPASTGETPA